MAKSEAAVVTVVASWLARLACKVLNAKIPAPRSRCSASKAAWTVLYA